MKINCLKPNLKSVELIATIKDLEEKTKDGKCNLFFVLGDSTGEIRAALFDTTKDIQNIYSKGTVVKCYINTKVWQGRLSCIIEKIHKAESWEYKNEDIFEITSENPKMIIASIKSYIDCISDEEIRILVEKIINENESKLIKAYGSLRSSHNISGGLIFHIKTMLDNSISLINSYNLNKDYVYSGIILHDIGKLKEIEYHSTEIPSQYSFEGKFYNHQNIGAMYISEVGKKLNINHKKLTILINIVLSHHVNSDIKPITKEAFIVSNLNSIDETLWKFSQTLKSVDKGNFTEKIYSSDSILYNL